MSQQHEHVSPLPSRKDVARGRREPPFSRRPQPDGRRREVVGDWQLRPVSQRPPLRRYIAELWGRRFFIWTDARSRAFAVGRGTILGNAWLVLQPLLNGLIYLLIFGVLLGISRGMDNYMGYLIVGVFMFQFTARSLEGGATAVTGSKAMIRGFTFPRAALPISVVLRETLNMLPVVTTMLVLIVLVPPIEADGWSPPHADVTWRWLLFPAVFGLQAVFNLGIAFFASRIVAQVPDVRHLLQFVRRLWFYGSAVMFTFDRFVEDPDVLAVLELNPAFIVLDMSRDLLVYGVTPEPRSWLLLLGWAAGTAILGFLYFWRGEERYGRE